MNTSDDSIQEKGPHVGYRNPPRHSRFKKGTSGNPKGRPKGTLNMITVLERALEQTVVIQENGKPKRVSKLEATFQQVASKAASGDLKAAQLLAAWARSAEGRQEQSSAANIDFDEIDKKVLDGINRRLEAAKRQGDCSK
jgi:hypothetical protein